MNLLKKATIGFTVLLLTYSLLAFAWPGACYEPRKAAFGASFEQFYEARLRESNEKKVRPGNEEHLIRFAKTTEIAFLYVHGFGSSRGEGEYLMRKLAHRYRANTYLMRLPGHGETKEAHRDTDYRRYIASVEETLLVMPELGKRVFIVATSMGGAIATYLAGYHQNKIAGLVLLSPFFDFASPSARALALPGGVYLAELALGKYRFLDSKRATRGENIPRWHDYWYLPVLLFPLFL